MLKWIQRLVAIPKLLNGYAVLRADIMALLRDPGVLTALDRLKNDPAVAPVIPRISAEWREVENAVNSLK